MSSVLFTCSKMRVCVFVWLSLTTSESDKAWQGKIVRKKEKEPMKKREEEEKRIPRSWMMLGDQKGGRENKGREERGAREEMEELSSTSAKAKKRFFRKKII